MVVIVSCKNEVGPIKNLGAGRNSISSKHLCMSLKPARMKKIESKIKHAIKGQFVHCSVQLLSIVRQ